jgi:hypothetical protein
MVARVAPMAARMRRRTAFVRGPSCGAAQHRTSEREESGPASPLWCKLASCCTDGPLGSHCGASGGPRLARVVGSHHGLLLQGSFPAAAPSGTTARTGPTTVVQRAAGATWTLALASAVPAPFVSQGKGRRAARPMGARRRGSAARPSTTSWTRPLLPPAPLRSRRLPPAASCRHRAAQPMGRIRATPPCGSGPTPPIAAARALRCLACGGQCPTMPWIRRLRVHSVRGQGQPRHLRLHGLAAIRQRSPPAHAVHPSARG